MREIFSQHCREFFFAITGLLKEIDRLDEDQKCLQIYRSHKPTIQLYDGVKELIEELKAKGIKIGIITDGRPEGQRNKIEALGLEEIIESDDIIITDELGGTQFRKPCDIAFRIILTRWRLNPADVVYVGDNADKDFQAPQRLGMRSVWFKNEDGLYSSSEKTRFVCNISEVKNSII